MQGPHKIAGRTVIGSPPIKFTGKAETMIFDIHDFAEREEKRNKMFFTGEIVAHGFPWKLQIYPRGSYEGAYNDFSVYLNYAGNIAKGHSFFFSAKIRTKITEKLFEKNECTNEKTKWGFDNFKQRNAVINNDCDENGMLTIFVDIEVAMRTAPVWYPTLTGHEDFLSRLYKSRDKTADLSFIVGKSRKKCNAHKLILELQAKELLELVLAESSDGEENNILLENIDEAAFETMIEFIYTGKKLELNDDMYVTESILMTANYFGCIDLKLYLESVMIEKILNASTAARLLLFADSYCCALLKESAMDIHMMDHLGFIGGEGWSRLQESPKLLSELLCYRSSCRKSYSSFIESDEQVEDIDVTSLRERLEGSNLDVDGSREVLVERWKTHMREFKTFEDVLAGLNSSTPK
mmetsp:Transcript_26032/g.38478  ORF Transcript_26032/g.38478 Transcript_26032/m.38478 type:complete len:409 (-) Transcript_26032:150-1376(-)|eukprot:CAMPEP_0194216494 /NCGR_PEP_ID=MMETSP0156-20130528/19090_1 /TAXON_ID=33649 /ORGANISM="Thalassionema nitzschioides, Strain L26-B" /LENGTH=408 /DNA_ID=CAMNT_0038945281 /DNA_START=225 /DNA_END=1451 /DNA_ORIENTATION=-